MCTRPPAQCKAEDVQASDAPERHNALIMGERMRPLEELGAIIELRVMAQDIIGLNFNRFPLGEKGSGSALEDKGFTRVYFTLVQGLGFSLGFD